MPETRRTKSRRRAPLCWPLVLAALVLAAFCQPARAHRVLIYAYAQGDTIHTESKFADDTPVRQGEVQVRDRQSGRVLLTGKTDDRGNFSFRIPFAAAVQKLDLEIVLEAEMGHRAEWLLRSANYLAGMKPPAAAASDPAKAAAVSTAPPDRQALEAAINKALEQQLAPVKQMLTQLTVHRTSPTDIIGGLGYIVGLFGLWAYFHSRRKKDP